MDVSKWLNFTRLAVIQQYLFFLGGYVIIL